MKTLLPFGLVLAFAVALRAVEIPLDATQSSINFTGHAFMHDFEGEAKKFSGEANVGSEKAVVKTATLDVQVAKMTTFENERDHNMLAWLKVEVNPEISFHLTRVTVFEGDPQHATRDHPAHFTVVGNLSLNKVSKPLEAKVAGWREGQLLVVTGSTQVDTESYGLPLIKKLFLAVDKHVDVEFHLAFDLPRELQATVPPWEAALAA